MSLYFSETSKKRHYPGENNIGLRKTKKQYKNNLTIRFVSSNSKDNLVDNQSNQDARNTDESSNGKDFNDHLKLFPYSSHDLPPTPIGDSPRNTLCHDW